MKIKGGSHPASFINKADINTSTGVITTVPVPYYLIDDPPEKKHFVAVAINSSLAITKLPKNLKPQTVYYTDKIDGVENFKIYSDEALTTQIMFTADDISEVTQFQWLPIESHGYAQSFHTGSSTLAEMVCCPPDRVRNLAKNCNVYNASGTLVKTLRFQSNPRGFFWGFWADDKGDFVNRGGTPYQYYWASIDIDYADTRKIIISYAHDLGSSLPYKSTSILKEDFTGTVTVFRPSTLPAFYPASYTLVFHTDAKVPPYARVKLPAAKFKSPEGDTSIGNIEEILTFDESSNRYVGSVQTYYGIKGRLFLDVAFYPKPSDGIKYLGRINSEAHTSYSVSFLQCGSIVNFDITRTYNDFDRPQGGGSIRGGVIPFIFGYSGVFFDSSYKFVYTSGGGSYYQDGYYTASTNTPGQTYLAVGFAKISKGTKGGYNVDYDAPYYFGLKYGDAGDYNGIPADQNFRKTNVIKIVSTSDEAFVRSATSLSPTPPPMPTPTPTPTPTPKGTYLQTVPSVPFITSADGGSGSPAIINFEPPLNNGGASITRYEYQVDGGAWSNGGPQTPVSISPLSVGSHTVCLRAVNSVGAGPSVCVSVTHAAGITNAFTYVGQTGAGTYSGEGLKYYNPTRGTIVAGNTVETMTFTTLIAGVLAYDYSTNDLNALGAYGDMTLDGVSMGSISGTQRNSSTLDVVAGQVIVLSLTGEPEKTSTFEFAMFISLTP